MPRSMHSHSRSTAAATAPPPSRPRAHWGRLFPLMTAHFVNDLYANMLPAFLPLLKVKFDLSLALVGVLSTAFTVTASLMQVAFGLLGDRLRRVNFIVWGPLLTGLFMSLLGLMPVYPLVAVLLVLAGLGTAMFHPQATARSGQLVKGRKGVSISLFIAGGTLGFSLGPLLAAALLAWVGLAGSFWMALPLLVLLVVLLKTVPGVPQGSAAPQRLLDSLRPLLILWLIVVLRHAVFLSFITYLLILLQERGLSYLAGSGSLFAFLLSGTLGSLMGGALSDRFGRRRVVLVSFVSAYPLLAAFLHTGGWGSFAFLALAGALLAATNPVIVAHAQEILPTQASTASAITMGFGWGAGALLVSGVGALADRVGIVTALDGVSLALPLAAVLAWRLRPAGVDSESA